MKDKIEKALAELDPMGLCKIGAPQDEYSSEAEDIECNLLLHPKTDLEQLCRQVFELSFSEDLVKHISFAAMAEKLKEFL